MDCRQFFISTCRKNYAVAPYSWKVDVGSELIEKATLGKQRTITKRTTTNNSDTKNENKNDKKGHNNQTGRRRQT
jgi:hypothetical protein